MTECTEVSYVVPSYFFLRCRRSSEERTKLQKNTAKVKSKILQLYGICCVFLVPKIIQHKINLASLTSQRITLICVIIVKFWNNIGGNVVRENCV